MHEATVRYCNELGVSAPVLSYNGAMVKHTGSGEVWHHLRVPARPAAEVVRFCAEQNHHLNYYLDDHLYVASRTEWAEFYVRQTGSPMEEIGDLRGFAGSRPTKMILIDGEDVTDTLFESMTALHGTSMYITKTNAEYLEFMNPDANKGTALKLVAERLGIPREEVAAFGDGDNDLSMIQWAGVGVAMGNAKPAVLAAADRVAPVCDEDGLACAVEEMLG